MSPILRKNPMVFEIASRSLFRRPSVVGSSSCGRARTHRWLHSSWCSNVRSQVCDRRLDLFLPLLWGAQLPSDHHRVVGPEPAVGSARAGATSFDRKFATDDLDSFLPLSPTPNPSPSPPIRRARLVRLLLVPLLPHSPRSMHRHRRHHCCNILVFSSFLKKIKK